nr:hypothetical protein [Saprospiraceae bacterium]
MKRLFLYFIPSLCFCFPLVAQQPELILQDKFYLEEIEYEELRTITHFPGSGNLKVLDETRGILLFGMVELALLDLQTGEIGKKMDVHELFRWVSDALYEHWGEEYCVPGREAFMQLKPKHYPIRFDRVLKYPGKNLYASLTHTVVLNQETEEEERDNFIGLVVFNEELEIVDFFPLKGYEELR